jgi:hypothetical protein
MKKGSGWNDWVELSAYLLGLLALAAATVSFFSAGRSCSGRRTPNGLTAASSVPSFLADSTVPLWRCQT